jgi:hypothetical protein
VELFRNAKYAGKGENYNQFDLSLEIIAAASVLSITASSNHKELRS